MSGGSCWSSDRLALRSVRAVEVGPQQAPVLHGVVTDLARTMGVPVPRVCISPTEAPNAFAVGRPGNPAVCCTDGVLRLLDERELRAVLGHELAHVGDGDVLPGSVAAALATVVLLPAQLAQVATPSGRRGGSSPFAALLLVLLGPVAASVLRLGISRSREYEADATGARVTGDPLALARALRKIERGTALRPLPQDPRLATTSALMIATPFRGGGGLFGTHPPMADRIARLEAMAGYR